jgi:hypothetical protein
MPAKVKEKAGGGYQVSTPEGVTAKNTTKENADSQARLLNAIAHGYDPKKRKTGSRGDINHETTCPGIGKSKMSTKHMGEHICKE